MATNKKRDNKPWDVTANGAAAWRQLQEENARQFQGGARELGLPSFRTVLPSALEYDYEGPEKSPLMEQTTRLGNRDYLGNSVWDPQDITTDQLENLSDIRAENQPWYSKLLNGIGKAGVLAGTTALETAGLLYGAGHSMLETAGVIEDNGKSWLQDLWDNPITNALQRLNDASEEYMPNYYTQDEIENPFGNIFTANFLGDKLLKNLGFMVGAFYGGMPAASLMGKAGTAAVRGARRAAQAEMGGLARRFGELTAEYGDDVLGKVGQYGREIQGLSKETAASIGSKYGEDVTNLYRKLSQEGLTEGERGKRMLESLDKINNVAQTTRATTQTIGSLGSAINEGAIEALNNSKDWANMATKQENERYQAELEKELGKIDMALGGTEVAESAKIQKRMELAAKHQKQLEEIEKGRAMMGNADLLLNIPVLMASNMYQLGKLYTRGFDSTRRQMGSLWNEHKLSGDLANGTLKSDKTWKGAVGSALLKSNTEGLEEYLQRAASDGAGNAVNESIQRFFDAGQNGEAKIDVDDYIVGFGKAIATNLGDPNAWEEYMIGALSSMIGMPVFGSQTKNAYGFMKNNGVFGFAGGVIGNYNDYMDAKKHESDIANHLNERVKNPKFKALYDNLKKQQDYDKWLQEEIAKGDKSKYKDLELESFYKDLNAAASSGHLEEFKQLVGYNTDYTDEELEDIVKQTSKTVSAEQQRRQDKIRRTVLEKEYGFSPGNTISGDRDAIDEYEAINARLAQDEESKKEGSTAESPYKDKLEGPFIDRNGQMNVTDPDRMREILERNRQNLLQGIDDYLKIRNDIDIETDGRLDDEQIELLTQMKGHILDYDKRSAEMVDDILSNLESSGIKDTVEEWKSESNNRIEGAQTKYNEAKAHWEKVKNEKHSQEYKNDVEKKYLEAEINLKEAKNDARNYDIALELLGWLLEEKDTTARERLAEAKGYGDGIERVVSLFDINQKRRINSDEALYRLANPMDTDHLSPNVENLAKLIFMAPTLDRATKLRLLKEAVDLGRLANKKLEYRNKIREYLNDPTLIKEASKKNAEIISQKELDNKSEELALNIKNANSMADLDRIMTDAYNVNSDVAKAAIDKVKQTGDESTKKFIDDYEKAIDFRGNFSRQAMKLPENIAASILGTAANEWEKALEEGVDVQDKFIEGMTEAAEDFDREGLPIHKEIAAGIRQVLSTLNAAKTSTATNKDTRKSTKKGNNVEEGESSEKERKGFAALKERLAAKKAKEAEENNKKEGTADTKDSLQKAVEQEAKDSKQKNGSYKIDELKKLSKELQDRIQKFNEENPGSEFFVDFEQLLQRLTDEDIVNDADNLVDEDIEEDDTDLGDDNDGSDRAEKMHENLRVTFKSDNPTAFRLSDGDVWLDYRIPYEPTVDELMENNPKLTERQAQELKNRIEAVRNLLMQYKAYQFIDNNYLGYIAKALDGEPITVHLLRSTDDTFNKDKTHPITFLAIEWNDKVKNAIVKYGFNGKEKEFKNKVNPVTIDGKQYHIVGVMSLNGQVAPEVSQAFASLQGALNQELNSQIEEAKVNNQPFVVSEKTTVINKINTGRLDKRNNKDDDREKVSLYEFMTSQQGDNSRAVSSEWSTGMEFYFGTVVNGMPNTIEDEQVQDQIEEPNSTWMKRNNGAIVMFIPKADGMLYPVRVTRRTVADWLEADTDGSHNGRQLLQAVLDGSVKNEYLENIISYLKDIYDEEATISDKMTAKMMLQKYFIFNSRKDGKNSIHFNGGDITLQFDGKEYDVNRDTFEEFVTAFFDVLAKENRKFTLPAHSIEEVNGRDVITSGVFEIGLRGFYNFNANFTIVPIDDTGNPVTVESSSGTDEYFAGSGHMNEGVREYDFGDGMKKYYVTPDSTGTFTKVVNEDGTPVSTDILNLINLMEAAQNGGLPSYKENLINEKYKRSPKVRDFVLKGVKGFNDIFLIDGEEKWIYRQGDSKPVKLSSKEGQEIKNKLDSALKSFALENVTKIKELKEEATPVVKAGDSKFSKEDAEVSLRNVGKQMKDAMNTSGDIEVMEALLELGQVAIDQAREAGVGEGIIKNIEGIYKGLQVKYNNHKKAADKAKEDTNAGEQETPKMFAGKTLEDLDAKSGDLEALLVAKRKSPIIRGIPEKNGKPARMGVWEALQMADSIGKPIDKNDVTRKIIAVLEADRSQKEQMLADLVHEITCG